MKELDTLFIPSTTSIQKLFNIGNFGYYIPAYQRPYSWTESNIRKFFEDIDTGLKELKMNDEAATFMGTFIFVKDQRHETIDPADFYNMPDGISLIIDGQQRITTIFLVLFCLYKKLKKLNIENQMMVNENLNLTSTIEKMMWFDMNYSLPQRGAKSQFYPRVVKAVEDKWSRNSNLCQYEYGLTKLLFKALDLRDNENEKLKVKDIISKEKFPLIVEACDTIDEFIELISNGRGNENNTEDDYIFLDSLSLGDEKIKKFLWDNNKDLNRENFTEDDNCFLRLLIFSHYFLNRVAITRVTALDESYAFDMFESLNTTGQQLTSLETFKPLVIKSVQQKLWDRSISKKYFDDIESYITLLESNAKSNKSDEAKKIATDILLRHFALGEYSIKLSNRLNEQRSLLKKYLNTETNLDKEKYLSHLSSYAKFLKNIWNYQDISIEGLSRDELDLLKFVINAFDDIGHEMPISILSRYYHSLVNNQITSSEFLDAVKATCAFFILYRSTRVTTSGIDQRYRDLFNEDFGFSRKNGDFPPNVSDLKTAYRNFLSEEKIGIIDLETFSSKFKKISFKNSKKLAKLCLFISHNNTSVSDKKLVFNDRGSVYNILSKEYWINEEFDLEHIAPLENKHNWSTDIYNSEEGTIWFIGNLTLLPKSVNRSIQNVSQEKKWLIYNALSCRNSEELNLILQQVSENNIGKNRQEIIEKSQYYFHLSSIPKYKDWNAGTIEFRGSNIAELLWLNLSKWLSF